MKLLLTIVFGICIAVIIVVVPIQLRRQRETKRQANFDAHLKMLSEGIEKTTQQNPDLVGDIEVHSSSGSICDIWGFPPSPDIVLEEIRIADEVYSDWDYIVHIHEGAEQYLGASHFESLQAKFNKIKGIEACKQEDREIFLIRTKRLSMDQLRKAIWDEFLATAEASQNGRSRL